MTHLIPSTVLGTYHCITSDVNIREKYMRAVDCPHEMSLFGKQNAIIDI